MRSAYSLPPNCMIANCQDLDSQFGKKLPKKKNYHLFLTTILHFFSTERREKRTRSFVFLIFFFFFPSPLSPQMLDKTCISVSSSHNRVRLLRRYLVRSPSLKDLLSPVAKRGCIIRGWDRGVFVAFVAKTCQRFIEESFLDSTKFVSAKMVKRSTPVRYELRRETSKCPFPRLSITVPRIPPRFIPSPPSEELLHSGFLTWHARLSFKGADRVRGRIPLSERSCYGAATCYLLWKWYGDKARGSDGKCSG